MEAMAAVGVGLLIGAVLGLIGAGGAIVAVPAFVYLFGFSPLAATTASLAVVAASAASGMIPRLRQRQVDVRLALGFWVLGLLGTFAGARLARVLDDVVVLVGFAVVMVAAAVAMWNKSNEADSVSPRGHSAVRLVVAAMGIGLLTGLFGVGGGFLIVPALVLVFRYPFGTAVGTSLLVIALNSVTALAFKADTWAEVEWHVPLLVVVGGLTGSIVTSNLKLGIPQRLLERVFAVVLVALAGWMMIETFWLGA